MKSTEELCRRVRRTIIEASYKVKACHIGSALSAVEILVDLYFNRMKPSDIFIFSKASGVSALYAVLAEKKIIPRNKVAYYLKHYPLASSSVPGVFCSVGSLGHGLPISVGVAYANRKRDVYCLISDAEVQEGTFWGSLLFARHHKLGNLKIICDKNGFQAMGRTKDILDIDIPLYKAQQIFPIEVVYTVKGNGGNTACTLFANNNVWHYKNLNKETFTSAIKLLSKKKM